MKLKHTHFVFQYFVILFSLLLNTSISIFGQSKFVKVIPNYSMGNDCFSKDDVNFDGFLIDENQNKIGSVDYVTNGNTAPGAALVTVGSKIGIGALNSYKNNYLYSPLITVNDYTDSVSMTGIHAEYGPFGCTWASLSGVAYFYAPYEIKTVTEIESMSLLGITCVKSPTAPLVQFKVDALTRPYNITFIYLILEDIAGNELNRKLLGYGPGTYNLSYDEIRGSNDIENIPVKFRYLTTFYYTSGYTPIAYDCKGSATYGSCTFTSQFPKPTITSYSSTCFGQANASIKLDFTSKDVTQYDFSINKLKRKSNINDPCDSSKSTRRSFSEYAKDRNYCLTGESANVIPSSSNITMTIDNTSLNETTDNSGLKGKFGAGAYQLTVESKNKASCIFDTLIIIPETPAVVLKSTSAKNTYTSDIDKVNYQINSFGGNDAIVINSGGGHPPYQYSVDNGVHFTSPINDSAYIYSGLAASDKYIVKVKDSRGCSPFTGDAVPITLTQPDTITIPSSFISTVSCNILNSGNTHDGSIQLGLKGGIGGYKVSINPVSGKNYSSKTTDFMLDSLEAKTYVIHIKDKYVTSKDTTVIIPSYDHLFTNTIIDTDKHWPHCVGGHNGFINVSGTGGVQNSSKNYRFRITDPYGIEKDTTNNDNILTGLDALIPYTIKITDNLGCSDIVNNIIIPQNPKPLTTVLVDTIKPLCNDFADGTATFTAINGDPNHSPYYGFDFRLKNAVDSTKYDETLSGSLVEFENIHRGVYQISVQDSNLCDINNYYRDTIFISEPAPISILDSVRQVTRKGLKDGYLQVTLAGGNRKYEFEWYNGMTAFGDSLIKSGKTDNVAFIDKLAAGDYLLRLRDTCSCNNGEGDDAWLEWIRHIGEPTKALNFIVKEHKNISCNGLKDGRLVIEGFGGWGNNYRYALNAGKFSYDGEFDHLPAGLDTIYVMDQQNVVFSDTISIIQPEKLAATLESEKQPACHGDNDGNISLFVSGGTLPYYVSIDNNINKTEGTFISGLKADIYNIMISDHNSCTTQLQKTLAQPDSLEVILVNLKETTCGESTGSITVNSSGGTAGYTYEWLDNNGKALGTSTVLNNQPQGEYRVTTTDTHNCKTQSVKYIIANSDGPVVKDSIITPVSCFGLADGKIQITAARGIAPYTYKWSTDATSDNILNLKTGWYSVIITDNKNCPNTYNVKVPEPSILSLQILNLTNPQCFGYSNGSINVSGFGGTSPYKYGWNDGTLKDSISGLTEGSYTAKITDHNGCKFDSIIALKNPPPVTIDLGGETTICPGQFVPLDAGNYSSVLWNSDNGFTSNEQKVSLDKQGRYFLKVVDSHGCIGGDTFKITTSASLLNADFIIKSDAFTGDTIVAVDISWPLPGSVHWVYDTTSINHFSQPDYENLIFTKPGTYTITMYATLGGCKDNYSQDITISEKDIKKSSDIDAEQPLIQKFIVHPNPNNGNFTVDIELREQSDITLKLFGGSTIMDQKKINGLSSYTVSYSVPGLTKGIYILQLSAGNELKQFKLVIY